MKKILLFIGLSVMTFGAFATKVPSVVVNKSNGGWTALLNLYNYVTYTPAELSPTGVGQLDCTGNGFTACRVPNCTGLNVNDGNSVTFITDAGKIVSFKNAINDVIAQYESAQAATMNPNSDKAAYVPTCYTKTISFSGKAIGNGKKKQDTFVVRGVVKANSGNSSTMEIYIEKVDLFAIAGNN